MKIKNNLLDKKVIQQFVSLMAIIELLLSLILIFIDIPQNYKIGFGIVFSVILIIIYIIIWILSNKIMDINITINNSKVEIKYGDIFEESGKKVIAFNEYFDTCVDDNIINSQSINGQFILNNITDVDEFDKLISQKLSERNKKPIIERNRKIGKKEKFNLGTMIKYNKDFLLMSFTRFNANNCAELSMQEYITCLIEMWNELDILYSQDTIVIPLLGSGTNIFKDYKISEQELLELILWTFKISKIKFTYPSKLIIVIHPSLMDKINLYKIKEEYKYVI